MSNPGFSLLQEQLSAAAMRHECRYKEHVALLISRLERQYDTDVDSVLSPLNDDPVLSPLIAPHYECIRRLCIQNRWVGWELCDFGPVLNIDPIQCFSIAMLVYNALHLMDDGIDGHVHYQTPAVKSFYGHLKDMQYNERVSCSISALIGTSIINASLHSLLARREYSGAHTLMRLIGRVTAGMAAESLSGAPLSLGDYNHIVRSKSVAYQMILEHIFFSAVADAVRTRLLSARARMIEIAQMVDDLMDERADRSAGTFTIFNVKGMNRKRLTVLILESMEHLWRESGTFSMEIRDVLGKHLFNWLSLFGRGMDA